MWLVLPTSANARIILQEARITAITEFDTNPVLSSTNKQSIWRYIANPNYKIVAEDDVSQFYLDAGMRFQRSSDRKISIDREDPVLTAGWTRQFERSKLGFLTSYVRTSTRITEFDETGTGLVQKDGTSVTRSASLNGSHQLTELLSLNAGLNYRKQDFSGTNLNNFSSKGFSLGLSYAYSEKISPFMNYSVNDFRPENPASNRNISRNILLGVNILVSPQLTSSFSYGRNHISSTDQSGWIANAGLTYDDYRHHYTANYNRSVNATGAGTGGFLESDRMALTYSYDLSSLSKLGANYNISKNNSINDAQTENFSAWYSRELAPEWNLRLSIQHKQLDTNSTSAQSDIAGISINYQWSDF